MEEEGPVFTEIKIILTWNSSSHLHSFAYSMHFYFLFPSDFYILEVKFTISVSEYLMNGDNIWEVIVTAHNGCWLLVLGILEQANKASL